MTEPLQEFRLHEVVWEGGLPVDVSGAEPIGYLARDDAEARRVLAFVAHVTGRHFRLATPRES